MTDPNFEPFSFPAFALDAKTNTGVLAGDSNCDPCTPDIGLVNLVTGEFSHFLGVGSGSIYGLAVDSEDGIACTTTSADANLQFYDLKASTGFTEDLPGGEGQAQSGFDVEYDPIHKLFLIFQPDGPGEHSFIQVYDPKGNLVDSVDFGPFNRFGGYIALQPKQRSGFLGEGPVLRSFTY
jgi:WD40 repeat protein